MIPGNTGWELGKGDKEVKLLIKGALPAIVNLRNQGSYTNSHQSLVEDYMCITVLRIEQVIRQRNRCWETESGWHALKQKGCRSLDRAPTASAAPNQTPLVHSTITLKALLAWVSWKTEEGNGDWLHYQTSRKVNPVENWYGESIIILRLRHWARELLLNISLMFQIVRTQTQKKWVVFLSSRKTKPNMQFSFRHSGLWYDLPWSCLDSSNLDSSREFHVVGGIFVLSACCLNSIPNFSQVNLNPLSLQEITFGHSTLYPLCFPKQEHD